jgi:hypothetical protein
MPELTFRVYATLYNLARGHALVHGRRVLTDDDMPLVAQLTVSSMPTERRKLFLALVHQGGQTLNVRQVGTVLGQRHHHTALQAISRAARLSVFHHVERSDEGATSLRLADDWAWAALPPYRELFQAIL